jgi:hypothetical protein
MAVEGIMVSHCINPACRIELKCFDNGHLYAHDRGAVAAEFFWLCSSCASQLVPYLDSTGRVSVMLRSDSRGSPPSRIDGYLRLVTSPMKKNPWSTSVPAGLRKLA